MNKNESLNDPELTAENPSQPAQEDIAPPAEENTAPPAEETTAEPSQETAEENTSQPMYERVDCVRPADTFRQHHSARSRAKRRREKARNRKTKKIESPDAVEGYVFLSPRKKRRRHKRHRRRWKRVVFVVLCVILAIVLATATTYIVLRSIGQSQMREQYDDVAITLPEDSEVIKDAEIIGDGSTITYGGETYTLNKNISTITFIGIDDSYDEIEHSMSDAIYILAIDPDRKKLSLISVSRDTMADVNIYSDEGKFVESEVMQMAYCYSYGNEYISGGENTNSSLTKLFFGMPFKDYYAMNIDALKELNDKVGGVTLTSSLTFQSPIDGRTINEGETVTLYGSEAERYVRSRETDMLESNDDRMKRQREYISAFLDSMIPAAKKDIGVVSELYNTVKVNSSTSLSLPKITYLASTAAGLANSASDIEFISLQGKFKEGEFAEFYLDDKNVLETMLNVFYTKE